MDWKSLGNIMGLLYGVHLGTTGLLIVGLFLVILKVLDVYKCVKVAKINNENKHKQKNRKGQ